MAPIRATRALPKRQGLKTANENTLSTAAAYGVKQTNAGLVMPVAAAVKPAAASKATKIPAAANRGILGEVTNARLANAPPGITTRRGSKGKDASLAVKTEHETPKDQASPELYSTPLEQFPEEKKDVEVEMMELDTTIGFVGASGRTVDLVTGKELFYDLSKVVDYDSQNEKKLEEYSLYVEDVFRYYRQRENDQQFWIDPNYIERQKDINWTMRAILVDWLVDLQESFALSHETLYLSVKIVDLYLTKAKEALARDKLQLLGITAVFIASKYEERNYVRVDDLVYMTEDSYKIAEVFTMEIEVLKTIGFQLGHPMSYRFLRRFAKARQLTMEVLTLARYILESSLMDYTFLGERESHVAAGALYLARKMTNPGLPDAWDDTLIHYSAVDASTARCMALRLNAMLRRPRKNLQTVQAKYDHEVFMKVGLTKQVQDSSL